MNRKSFLRNAMMALAVSLVPKILRPIEFKTEEMKMAEIKRNDMINKVPPKGKRLYSFKYRFRYENNPWSELRKYSYGK